jgi:hypothetical protein
MKFVCTEYPLDLERLSLARLKKLTALISYINWLELGESSKSPTTKAFARVFMKVRMGSDTMAARIMKDLEVQIVRTIRELRSLLAELVAFSRESWKADVRRVVLPGLSPGSAEGEVQREEMIRAIRRAFPEVMRGTPWYPSLAEEIADEELADNAEARRQKVLASLVVTAPVRSKPVAAADGRIILLDAMRLVCRPNGELVTAIAVLEENERLLAESRRPGGWLRRLFRRASTPKKADRVYKVQYTEPGASTVQTETIDFGLFAADVQKKSSLFASLSTGKGPAFKRLATTSEEELAGFVDKQLNELLVIHRRLGSLNALLQERVMKEKKTARGIKIELLTIKNALVKANQRRHEYKEKEARPLDVLPVHE